MKFLLKTILSCTFLCIGFNFLAEHPTRNANRKHVIEYGKDAVAEVELRTFRVNSGFVPGLGPYELVNHYYFFNFANSNKTVTANYTSADIGHETDYRFDRESLQKFLAESGEPFWAKKTPSSGPWKTNYGKVRIKYLRDNPEEFVLIDENLKPSVGLWYWIKTSVSFLIGCSSLPRLLIDVMCNKTT